MVVVNWNGWQDTIICVRSLFRLVGHPLFIVICDNASTDASFEQLTAWLGETWTGANCEIENCESGVGVIAFERAGKPHGEVLAIELLRLPVNLGYAGALNRGIRHGQKKFDARSFWLLNNDVLAAPDALEKLVDASDSVPNAGLCGSVLMEWDQPDTIQAIGGIYNRALAVGWHLRELPKQCPPGSAVCLELDYPVGASLFVEQHYLDKVGLMDDSYFLYYEEIDWVARGRRYGYRPVVALGSRLLHKEGASTGSHGGVRGKSLLSERHGVINRLRVTIKFWPALVPIVWLSLFAVVLERLVHGEVSRAALVLRLMFSPRVWKRAAPAA